MDMANISVVENIINYQFANQQMGKATLYAAGSIPAMRTGNDGNKVMAMLGDKVMATILLSDLIESGTSRVQINATVEALISNQNLANICVSTGISQYIVGSPGQGRPQAKTCSATVEAIIGAVFIDSEMNVDVTRAVMDALGMSAIPASSTG